MRRRSESLGHEDQSLLILVQCAVIEVGPLQQARFGEANGQERALQQWMRDATDGARVNCGGPRKAWPGAMRSTEAQSGGRQGNPRSLILIGGLALLTNCSLPASFFMASLKHSRRGLFDNSGILFAIKNYREKDRCISLALYWNLWEV